MNDTKHKKLFIHFYSYVEKIDMNTDYKALNKTIVLGVALLMTFTILVSFTTRPNAAKKPKEIEAPDWNKGDQWKYRIKVGPDTMGNVTQRIKNTDSRLTGITTGSGEEKEYDNVYHMVKEGKNKVHEFYQKESLSLIYSDTEGGGSTFYNPPLADFDFPHKVGEEWNDTSEEYVEKRTGYEQARRIRINGTVEKKVTVDVLAGEFEAYKLNVTLVTEKEEGVSIGRIVSYYSPKVKNNVLIESYETKLDPRGGEPTEKFTGRQVLFSYDLKTDNGNNNNNGNKIPLVNSGTVVFIFVTTAGLYSWKIRHKEK